MSVACHKALVRLSSVPRAIASSRSCRSVVAPFIPMTPVLGWPSCLCRQDAEFLWEQRLGNKRENPVKSADQFSQGKFDKKRGNEFTGTSRGSCDPSPAC